MTTDDQGGLLAAYQDQLRARPPAALPVGVSAERDGPLLRLAGVPGRGFVLYRDLDGLRDDALDALIARQIAFYAGRDEPFEWKLHGHDLPPDLPERLRAANFAPEPTETIVIAPVAAIAETPAPPPGVTLREVTARRDFERIAEMEAAVWGESHRDLVPMLEGERIADPRSIAIVVAEANGAVVSAAWIRFEAGTDFATLWGGATLPAWRRRGIYRATVAYRAGLAAERGFRLLEVDASDDSRPILERLGFVPVTTTTPWVWTPPQPERDGATARSTG